MSESRPELSPVVEDLAELTVLVPCWQAKALEQAAHEEGLSAGQFLRRLLGQALSQRPISHKS